MRARIQRKSAIVWAVRWSCWSKATAPGDLPVDLRCEGDREHDVADAAAAGDGLPDHEQGRSDVRSGECELARDPEERRADLAAPEDRGRLVPGEAVPRAELAGEIADPQLLRRPTVHRQREEVARPAHRVGRGLPRARAASDSARRPRMRGGIAATGSSSSHGLSRARRTAVTAIVTARPRLESSACMLPHPVRSSSCSHDLELVRVVRALVVLEPRRSRR